MVSHKKILITHTGSLPRPKPLTQLYTQMVAGKSINQEILDQQIATATRWVIKQQRDNGIDIPNNGEQCREAFFLYIQRRMTGFGGRGSRKPWGDLLDFPEFAEFSQANFAAKTMVSNRNPPVALREVKYIAPEKNLEEIDDFKTILSEDLILFKSEATSIFTLSLATSSNEFITELMLPEL